MKEAKKRFMIAIAISIVLFGAGLIGSSYMENNGFKFAANVSNSLPGTLYFARHKSVTNLSKKDIVMFKLPVDVPKEYGFQKGDTFLKVVTCTPGDVIATTEGKWHYTFSCNDKIVATAYKYDKLKNKLPHPSIDGVIPEGRYFVTTSHPKSFDSRYYGLIDQSALIGKASLLY